MLMELKALWGKGALNTPQAAIGGAAGGAIGGLIGAGQSGPH